MIFPFAVGTSVSQPDTGMDTTGGPPAGMVLIPGGEYMMGKDESGDSDPAHKVRVDTFYMDKYEVTNSEYLRFCTETDRTLPEYWGVDKYRCGPDFRDHPVVGVSQADAKAYAEWIGKRLPTEAEWEYAARGELVDKNYPFGDEADSAKANFKSKGTRPVGSYPPNGFGLYDMAGNVVEWVADSYDKDFYASSPEDNPTGPDKGKFGVIRGGGWHSGPYCNRVFFRNCLPKGWQDINVGFRCAWDQ
jgi:iron(II)-dependent oxidoreductase